MPRCSNPTHLRLVEPEWTRTRILRAGRAKADLEPFIGGVSNLDVRLVTLIFRQFNANEWIVLDLIAKGTLDPNEEFKRGKGPILPVAGPIMIQLGAKEGSLEFRKIEIKELPVGK